MNLEEAIISIFVIPVYLIIMLEFYFFIKKFTKKPFDN